MFMCNIFSLAGPNSLLFHWNMSQTKPKPTNNHIPENVEFNILAWLPVKSVIRFRCVCKPWDSFIISPYFISTHLNNNNSKYHGCFIKVPDYFDKKGKVCEVFCDRTYDIISEYPVPSGFDRFYVGSTSAGINSRFVQWPIVYSSL